MSETLINTNQNPATIRALGGVLMFLGMVLMGGMAALMLWINTIIANSNNPASTVRWKGSADHQQMVFLILVTVMAFGFSNFVTGAYQVFTGKRNLKLIWIIIGLWSVLLILTEVVQIFFES